MRKLLSMLYSFFDKRIITPISRIVYFIKKKLDKSRGWLDKLINKGTFLMYLSLAFAIVVFLLIDYKVLNLVETQYDVITNVPVVVTYNSASYVIEGVPETVDITITGRSSDIYLAKQLADYKVELDLTNYTPSDKAYKVEFKYVKFVDNVSYSLSPSYATVTIKQKISEVKSIAYDILNIDSLAPELSIASVTLSQNEVVVQGSQDVLDQVASVKALIDLSTQTLTKEGSYDITDVAIVAYDNEGNLMSNVEVVPSTISAEVVLGSYSKTLSLEVNTTGNLIAGKAISSIQINGKDSHTLTVYGDESQLSQLVSIPVTINIDGLGNETTKSYNLSISKPVGVSYIDGDTVSITVTFADEDQKTLNLDEYVKSINVEAGLAANILPTDGVTVQVKGVTSVIDEITMDDLVAYADLSGLSKGVHEVDVYIEDNNPLLSFIVSGKIKVEIS